MRVRSHAGVARPPQTRSKYKNVRTRGFASKAEADYADELAWFEREGHIGAVERQPPVVLVAGIVYVPDFRFDEYASGRAVYVDVKGVETAVFKLKAKLWRVFGPGLLRIVKRQGRGFVVVREIPGGQA